MQALHSRIATLLIAAATGVACGGNGSGPGDTFSTLEATPAAATLFTVAPGNTVTLSVAAKDQGGHTIAGAGTPSFSSDNGAVAGVGADGTITALAAGTALITVTLTIEGVTRTATTTVTSQVAPANPSVIAPSVAFLPVTQDVRAGGTVNWTFAAVPHNVTFSSGGSPANVPDLQNGSASRVFPTNGIYYYTCTTHPGMNGIVQVH